MNTGIENALNDVVSQLIKMAGIRDAYYLYAEQLCEGELGSGYDRDKDGIKIDKCKGYDSAALGKFHSSSFFLVLRNTRSPISLRKRRPSLPSNWSDKRLGPDCRRHLTIPQCRLL
jgi:hypothetical protein